MRLGSRFTAATIAVENSRTEVKRAVKIVAPARE
jgi:hypothetical protein